MLINIHEFQLNLLVLLKSSSEVMDLNGCVC